MRGLTLSPTLILLLLFTVLRVIFLAKVTFNKTDTNPLERTTCLLLSLTSVDRGYIWCKKSKIKTVPREREKPAHRRRELNRTHIVTQC